MEITKRDIAEFALPLTLAAGGAYLRNPLARVSTVSVICIGVATATDGETTSPLGVLIATLPLSAHEIWAAPGWLQKGGHLLNGAFSALGLLLAVRDAKHYHKRWKSANSPYSLDKDIKYRAFVNTTAHLVLPIVAYGICTFLSPQNALIGIGLLSWGGQIVSDKKYDGLINLRAPLSGMALAALASSLMGLRSNGGWRYGVATALNATLPIATAYSWYQFLTPEIQL